MIARSIDHGINVTVGPLQATAWIRAFSFDPPLFFLNHHHHQLLFTSSLAAMAILQNFLPMTRAKMAQLSLPDIRAYATVRSTRSPLSVAAMLTALVCPLGVQGPCRCC